MIVLWTPSETNGWNYLWHIPDSEKRQRSIQVNQRSRPVPSINTPITHAERRQCKQCGARRSGFLAAVAPSDWLDRSLEAFDVIGGEARHIDRRIIRVKLAWSFSIIQRKDLGWDSFRSEVWCTFNSLRVGELHRNQKSVYVREEGGVERRSHRLRSMKPIMPCISKLSVLYSMFYTLNSTLNTCILHIDLLVFLYSCTHFSLWRLFATFLGQNL